MREREQKKERKVFVTVYRLDRNTPPHHGRATLLLKWNHVTVSIGGQGIGIVS